MIRQECYEEITYLVRYPKNFDVSCLYPVIFHTHGAGSRGNDVSVLKTVGVLKEAINVNPRLDDMRQA